MVEIVSQRAVSIWSLVVWRPGYALFASLGVLRHVRDGQGLYLMHIYVEQGRKNAVVE